MVFVPVPGRLATKVMRVATVLFVTEAMEGDTVIVLSVVAIKRNPYSDVSMARIPG